MTSGGSNQADARTVGFTPPWIPGFGWSLQAANYPCPNIPGMIPGVAIHDEIAMLRSVGMTPFEALATATSNAGRFIATFAPKATPFGTVTVGARGDLLVVTANPLNDLSVLRAPMAVVRRGRVYSARQLDSIRVAPTS
jgi:hypothetical protein